MYKDKMNEPVRLHPELLFGSFKKAPHQEKSSHRYEGLPDNFTVCTLFIISSISVNELSIVIWSSQYGGMAICIQLIKLGLRILG
jgi:hypothetical protein